MLDNLKVFLYRYPALCRELGSAIYGLAGLGLIAGAMAEVGKLAASIVSGMAGQPPVEHMAQLLPDAWTAWVPESLLGFAAYLTLAAVGASFALTAKRVQRQLRCLC